MSTGGIIGAVVGGVIGFFVGGPMGAVYGAGMGFMIGMMIDPLTPDMPQIGTPDPVSSNVMTSTVGDPLPDILGTGKLPGHLLCYGKERSYTVPQQQQSGGKGGGGDVILSVDEGVDQPGSTVYYMTWALGLCIGPVTMLSSVFKENDLVWDGKLELPASGGQETITLDGLGSCTFYFGTEDQVANPIVNDLIPDSTLNSPLRKFCWALLDDCRIGNIDRTPSLSFMITKLPESDLLASNSIQEYDYNPAHAMWYILHNLAGLPTSWLNKSAFEAIGVSLLSEFRGISMSFVSHQSAMVYLQSINAHIDCILNYDSEGKFTPKLIRDDYNAEVVPIINEDIMIDSPSFTRKSWIDTVSEIKVQYTELIEVERSKGYLIYSAGRDCSGLLLREPTGGASHDPKFLSADTGLIIPKKIYGESNICFVVDINDYLYVVGDGSHGELGLGSGVITVDILTKVPIGNAKIKKVDCGQSSVMLLTTTGAVLCAGYNGNGQLGLGDYVSRYEYTEVSVPSIVTDISAGYVNHFLATVTGLFSSGPVTWNDGFVINTASNTFLRCDGTAGSWQSIVTGKYGYGASSLALSSGGSLYSCGSNAFGQSMNNDAGVGNKEFELAGAYTFTSICALANSTIGLTPDGQIMGVGFNYFGELGLGHSTPVPTVTLLDTGIKSISYGKDYSLSLSKDGIFKGCGENLHGCLGIDTGGFSVLTWTEISVDDKPKELPGVMPSYTSYFFGSRK